MSHLFLIGHRGVGKSSLLRNYRGNEYTIFDLDFEIEKHQQMTVKEIFEKHNREYFRNTERQVLNQLILNANKSKNQIMVALGAGFELERFNFGQDDILLWVRKKSDSAGRIFLDRPSLQPGVDPLDEWFNLFPKREDLYQRLSNSQFYIPEFIDENNDYVNDYLSFISPEQGFVTLIARENDFVIRKNNLNVELRTDLLSNPEILSFLGKKSSGKTLLSVRKLKASLSDIQNWGKVANHLDFIIDWDLDLGLPQEEIWKHIHIFSSHEPDPEISISKLESLVSSDTFKSNKHSLKICPCFSDHQEVRDFSKRLNSNFPQVKFSFLPRSANAEDRDFDLTYFRQLNSYTQGLGFYRFGMGSSEDQPFWWQWPTNQPKGYFGIIGQNINHSYTPGFHKRFFQDKGIYPFFTGDQEMLNPENCSSIKFFAVTSPYKKVVFKLFNFEEAHEAKEDLKSGNTLFCDQKKVFNTDFLAMKDFLLENIEKEFPTVVWGGGALLLQLKAIQPQAIFVSARTGLVRGGDLKIEGYLSEGQKINLIWASGQKGIEPPPQLDIVKIIDLDYRENSRAKLHSYNKGFKYISGYDFFVKQALLQQQLWDENEL